MKLEDMKPGMRVTFTSPKHPDVHFSGTVGQMIDNSQTNWIKIIQFDDGKTFILNEKAAEYFEPALPN